VNRAAVLLAFVLCSVPACDNGEPAGADAGIDAALFPLVDSMVSGRGAIWFENTLWADNQNLVRCADCEYVGVLDFSTPGVWVETFYAVTPGDTGVAEGARICAVVWNASIAPIAGVDASERVQVALTSTSGNCYSGLLEAGPYALAVAERDAETKPTAAALWEIRAGTSASDPFPGYNAGVWAVPIAPCPEGDRVAGRDYCEPLCDFDAPPCSAPAPP
jgi:hypothetical protein